MPVDRAARLNLAQMLEKGGEERLHHSVEQSPQQVPQFTMQPSNQ
jgi:hypothetical protein